MILIIDNYDSFTYNLYQYVGNLYPDIKVVRNDAITINEIDALHPQAIIISPGPGYPQKAGISMDIIKECSGKCPILGICLGHQAIGAAFGGTITHAKTLMHGKMSSVSIDTTAPIFTGLPPMIPVARYHSLIVNKESLPDCLTILGTDDDGQIMALKHKDHDTYGLQFHPESILTESGMKILENFLTKVVGLTLENLIETPATNTPRIALKPYLTKVVDGQDLSEQEAFSAMDCIMSGGATDAQISGFLTALRMKGETIEEITGLAKGMRSKAITIPDSTDAVDIVGTGGDLANSFNISTTSAFVISGAGKKVAKHGNRSVSSKSGAADVLESLGIKIGMSREKAKECLDTVGVTFLFAQAFHGSMKYVGPARKEMGIRTVFNILGPLASPALTDYIILGVYDKDLLEIMAKVLIKLGIKSAMIVHGNDGLDEISISDTTSVCEIRDGKMLSYQLDPRDYGLSLAKKTDIVGGTADENAQITKDILSGKELGPKRDIVLLNAACALYITGQATSIANGLQIARMSIDSGKAMAKLQALRAFTNE